MRSIPTYLMALVCTAIPTVAAAEGPHFDCRKAQGEVENLICHDTALAGLDQKLAEVYEAALTKAEGTMASQLRAQQRGWVKGRNDCWKAKDTTWITASWTVNTVKDCVDAHYRLRTAELQALWQLLPPTTLTYTCQNTPANELVVNAYTSDPATIRLERGDRTAILWRVETAGEGVFEGQNVSLVQQGTTLKVQWLNTDTGNTDALQCIPR